MIKLWAKLKAYFMPRKLSDCLKILQAESKEFSHVSVEIEQHLGCDVEIKWRVYSHNAGGFYAKSFEEAMEQWRNRDKKAGPGQDVLVGGPEIHTGEVLHPALK